MIIGRRGRRDIEAALGCGFAGFAALYYNRRTGLQAAWISTRNSSADSLSARRLRRSESRGQAVRAPRLRLCRAVLQSSHLLAIREDFPCVRAARTACPRVG